MTLVMEWIDLFHHVFIHGYFVTAPIIMMINHYEFWQCDLLGFSDDYIITKTILEITSTSRESADTAFFTAVLDPYVIIQPKTFGKLSIFGMALAGTVRCFPSFSSGRFMQRPLLFAKLFEYYNTCWFCRNFLNATDRNSIVKMRLIQIKIGSLQSCLRAVLELSVWKSTP